MQACLPTSSALSDTVTAAISADPVTPATTTVPITATLAHQTGLPTSAVSSHTTVLPSSILAATPVIATSAGQARLVRTHDKLPVPDTVAQMPIVFCVDEEHLVGLAAAIRFVALFLNVLDG